MTLFKFTKIVFHKRLYSIFIFRRLIFFRNYFSQYISRIMSLFYLQTLYIKDLNEFSNEKIEKPWVPIKSPQFRPNIVAIRIDPRMKNDETMSPYRMPPIWAFFRPPIWPAGPMFLALRPVWALEPRLCSLFVSGLAVENSASGDNR